MACLSSQFDFSIQWPEGYSARDLDLHKEHVDIVTIVSTLFKDTSWIEYDAQGKVRQVIITASSDQLLSAGSHGGSSDDQTMRDEIIKSYQAKGTLSPEQVAYVAREIVSQEKRDTHLVYLYPLETMEGETVSYLASYFLGDEDPPSLQEVVDGVNDYWQSRKEIPADRQAKTAAERDIQSLGEFLTLELSNNFDSPPVKKAYSGLPQSLTMLPASKSILRSDYGEKECDFTRVVTLSKLGLGFEYTEKRTGQRYYVDVLNGVSFIDWQQREKPGVTDPVLLKREKERKARINDEWEQVLFH